MFIAVFLLIFNKITPALWQVNVQQQIKSVHQYQQMQKEYKNMYMMMTKHNPFPSNCLPLSEKAKNSQSLKKLLDISRSIASLVNNDAEQINHKRRVSQYQVIDFKKNQQDRLASSKRIHHNYYHFVSSQTTRTLNPMEALNQQQKINKQKYDTIKEKANSTIITRRKDLYDNHIEKYMNTKYENDQLIKKYLNNKEMFIQEACQQIEKQIKQDFPINKKCGEDKKQRKYKSRLPKLQQATSHMLQKSITRNKDGLYIQQINQIKKIEELQQKQRKRKQRAFKHRLNSLQAKLYHYKSPIQ